MRVVYRRRRASRKACVFAAWFSVVIGVMLCLSTLLLCVRGELEFSAVFFMFLLCIPAPAFLFLRAALIEEAEKELRAQRARESEELARKRAEQAQLLQNAMEQERRRQKQVLQARLRNAFLQETRFLAVPPIIIGAGTPNEHTATEDFVITWLDGRVRCFPEAEAQGQLLGKFEFRDSFWHFTNLAPETVEVNFSGQPPMAPMDVCEVIPYPTEILYHSGDGINAITLLRAGWKK